MTSKQCMYGECADCKEKVVCTSLNDENKQNTTIRYKWTTKSEQRIRSSDMTEISVKVTKKKQSCEAKYEELIQIMQKDLPTFKQHAYRVYHQQAKMKEVKQNIYHLIVF